jgi:signal transduction histidine kinase
LLENLLKWAQSQTNQITFTLEKFDLNEIIDLSNIEIQNMAKNKEHTIIVEPIDKITMFGDKNLILFVLRNFLVNAVKFTPRKGEIKISANRNQKDIEISVRDNGIGISKDVIGNLFRIDTNFHKPGTEGESTTGLGLILCKEFVEKHGGKISVESEVGKGSVFTFSLPDTLDNKSEPMFIV